MRRTSLKVGLCVAAGMLLAAVVALACALVVPGDRVRTLSFEDVPATDPLMVGIRHPYPGDHAWIYARRHSLLGCTYMDVLAGSNPDLEGYWGMPEISILGHASHCDAGWPWRCVHGVVQPSFGSRSDGRWRFWEAGTWLPRPNGPVVEFRILWTGAIGDVLVFSAAAWIAGAGWLWMRRTRRLRRGLCPACAYDRSGLSGDALCPECGKTA